MASLSIINDRGQALGVANPIFPLDSIWGCVGAEIRFEVLEVDGDKLKTLIGTYQCFYVSATSPAFWARLDSLEPTVSIHPGLAGLRHERTLRGILSVIEEPPIKQ